MNALIQRHLKLFFRDKANVFFSLLSVLIIIGLYMLFLGNMLQEGMGDVPGARFLMDSWIMAGVLAVASMTTTLGGFGVMVEDKARKLQKDFFASPLRRRSLAASYVWGAAVVGVILSLVALIFGEAYILLYGGRLLSALNVLKLLGCIILSVVSSSALTFFLVSFFSSMSAFGTASTIIGTLIGFITGTYMPIGILPGPIQMIVKVFPVSHSCVLMRQIMMEAPMRDAFQGAPVQALDGFKQEMGVAFYFGDQAFPWWGSVLVLIATAIVFYWLAFAKLSRKRK